MVPMSCLVVGEVPCLYTWSSSARRSVTFCVSKYALIIFAVVCCVVVSREKIKAHRKITILMCCVGFEKFGSSASSVLVLALYAVADVFCLKRSSMRSMTLP